MNALDAFHSTVHSYPGGCEALAARMGIGHAVLRNKANPNFEHNKPTLADADLVMALSGNHAVLDALARNHGGVFVKVDDNADFSEMAVLKMVVLAASASGDVGQEVYATLADGIVEQHEVERVKAAAYRVTQAATQIVKRLEAMVHK
jgi:hypothetical protein